MCFTPHLRALFEHLNFQKCSEPEVCFVLFCSFWLPNVLRASNGVHFLNISTSKNAPRMVCFAHFDFEMCLAPQHLDISTSKSGPNMRCFAHFGFEMCFAPQRRPAALAFRPSGATNHWNNTVNRDFSTFSRLFPPLLFPPLLFHVSILPEAWLLKLPLLNQPLIWVNNG